MITLYLPHSFAKSAALWYQSVRKILHHLNLSLATHQLPLMALTKVSYLGAVKYVGWGHHLAALEQTSPNLVARYYKWLLAISFLYFLAVSIPKLAILAFYLRIFTIKTYRNIVYFLGAIVMTTGIVCSIVALNLCRPFKFNWDRKVLGGSCYNEDAFYRWGSLPNILTDIAILILPIPMVWKLHTSNDMKIGLTLTFLTASM